MSREREAEVLRYMWPDHTSKEIGDRLGLTRKCVESRARVMGLPRKRFPTTWSQGEVNIAMTMRTDGATAEEIGVQLGKSKSSVIGKFFRLGMGSNRAPRSVPMVKKMKSFTPPMRAKKMDRPPDSVPPTNNPVHILQRNDSQCTYLVGHHLMCGAEVYRAVDAFGHPRVASWCPYHYNLVFAGRAA